MEKKKTVTKSKKKIVKTTKANGEPRKKNKGNTESANRGIVNSKEMTTLPTGEVVSVHVANGLKGGRPPLWESVEELDRLVDAYINSCKGIDELGNKYYRQPMTMTGLAEELGTTRDVLINYGQKDGFANSITKARLACERYAEEQLFTNPRTAGVIFNMVNNYGWQNRYNQDSTIQVQQNNTITPTNTQILQNIQNIQDQLEKGDE